MDYDDSDDDEEEEEDEPFWDPDEEAPTNEGPTDEKRESISQPSSITQPQGSLSISSDESSVDADANPETSTKFPEDSVIVNEEIEPIFPLLQMIAGTRWRGYIMDKYGKEHEFVVRIGLRRNRQIEGTVIWPEE